MKRFGGQPELYFDEREFQTDLGKDNFIFVGSSCDMWAESIPEGWITSTLEHCRKYNNTYLFQSKNPKRFMEFVGQIPSAESSVLGTTIESDIRHMCMGNAPLPEDRAIAINALSNMFRTMVTVEPILAFNLEKLSRLVIMCKPAWVNIGADSKGHGLPEPDSDQIMELVEKLESNFIQVKLKHNIKRIMEETLWKKLKSHEIKL